MEDLNLYYQLLGVKKGASEEEIKEVHKDLVKVWHPDRFNHDPDLQKKANEKLKEINFAYERIIEYLEKIKSYSRKAEQASNNQPSDSGGQSPPSPPPNPPHMGKNPGDSQYRRNDNETNEEQISQVRPWVRYWARIFDICLFTTVIGYPFGYLMGSVFPSLAKQAIENPKGVDAMIVVFMLFIWVFVEAFLLATWGTTPGKWLLNIKVTSLTGGTLNFGEAIHRSFLVWTKGLCIGLPLFSFITLVMAHKKLIREGVTTWDKGGDFVVSHEKIGTVRVMVFLLIFAAIFTFSRIISNYKAEEMTFNDKSQKGSSKSIPHLAKDWTQKGIDLSKLGNHFGAIEAFTKAIQLDPNDDIAYYFRAESHYDLGNYQQAIRDYEKAIELKPNDAIYYSMRADCYEKLDNYQGAIHDYSKAIKYEPNEARYYSNRARCYEKLDNYQGAIHDYSKAIKYEPMHWLYYSLRGDAYGEIGDHERQINDYKNAARLGDKGSQGYLNRQGINW